MQPGEPAGQLEADVAAQLARAARRRWGLPRGSPPNITVALPAVFLNLALIFGSVLPAIAHTLGYLAKPYLCILAIQAGSAWLGVAMLWSFPRRYSLFHGIAGRSARSLYDAGERRIWLFGIWFPSVFVLLNYYAFISSLHPWFIMLPGCAIAVVLFIAAAAPDHELWSDRNRLNLFLSAPLCVAYGCAALLQVNCLFDRSRPVVYEATVSTTRKNSRSPHLTVGPWGPEEGSHSIAVPYRLYKSVKPGDRVCMVLRQGALQLSWYTAQPCPYNGAPILLEPGAAF